LRPRCSASSRHQPLSSAKTLRVPPWLLRSDRLVKPQAKIGLLLRSSVTIPRACLPRRKSAPGCCEKVLSHQQSSLVVVLKAPPTYSCRLSAFKSSGSSSRLDARHLLNGKRLVMPSKLQLMPCLWLCSRLRLLRHSNVKTLRSCLGLVRSDLNGWPSLRRRLSRLKHLLRFNVRTRPSALLLARSGLPSQIKLMPMPSQLSVQPLTCKLKKKRLRSAAGYSSSARRLGQPGLPSKNRQDHHLVLRKCHNRQAPCYGTTLHAPPRRLKSVQLARSALPAQWFRRMSRIRRRR